jgi:hypothetical protein
MILLINLNFTQSIHIHHFQKTCVVVCKETTRRQNFFKNIGKILIRHFMDIGTHKQQPSLHVKIQLIFEAEPWSILDEYSSNDDLNL